jgi:hypothetical protein
VSASTTTSRHVDEAIQLNLVGVLVEYGASGFIHEGGIITTWTFDVGDDSILALDYYREGTGVKYLSKHEDSMQVQILELVRIHAFAKKAKDVKWSYGRKIQQLSLELEHLQGIILYE